MRYLPRERERKRIQLVFTVHISITMALGCTACVEIKGVASRTHKSITNSFGMKDEPPHEWVALLVSNAYIMYH